MGRLILAFGYRRMSGKNTAAAFAYENLRERGMSVEYDSFAYSLKEMCRVVFGFNDAQLFGDLKGEVDPFWGFTPRWALQHAGTEAMRKVIDDDIWVKTLVQRVKQNPDTSILVTDLRFLNEVKAIQDLGGYLVLCQRELPFDHHIDTHASETALDEFNGWDYELDNEGSLDELRYQVNTMIDHFIGDNNDQNASKG